MTDKESKVSSESSTRAAATAFGWRLFTTISGWLVGPIVAAIFIGNWLDKRYDSHPWLLLISIGVAGLVSLLGITIPLARYIKETVDSISATTKKPGENETKFDSDDTV